VRRIATDHTGLATDPHRFLPAAVAQARAVALGGYDDEDAAEGSGTAAGGGAVGGGRPAALLVVDRTLDLLTPTLHPPHSLGARFASLLPRRVRSPPLLPRRRLLPPHSPRADCNERSHRTWSGHVRPPVEAWTLLEAVWEAATARRACTQDTSFAGRRRRRSRGACAGQWICACPWVQPRPCTRPCPRQATSSSCTGARWHIPNTPPPPPCWTRFSRGLLARCAPCAFQLPSLKTS
jgi:hypothetical protein